MPSYAGRTTNGGGGILTYLSSTELTSFEKRFKTTNVDGRFKYAVDNVYVVLPYKFLALIDQRNPQDHIVQKYVLQSTLAWI